MPQALKSCPKSNKSHNLVTLPKWQNVVPFQKLPKIILNFGLLFPPNNTHRVKKLPKLHWLERTPIKPFPWNLIQELFFQRVNSRSFSGLSHGSFDVKSFLVVKKTFQLFSFRTVPRWESYCKDIFKGKFYVEIVRGHFIIILNW